ncbi:thioesterase II family protein [Chitinophaga sp. GbtcB8]|uniref:thioesterase II family protein n=1 Tax=Chitinophaga sp. GbtcB8 TaxID=2824753 RepID=UPI001C3079B2|nr:alpha/beta fold hydrolase [Chitinophaga sp. GbtcB8]
MEPNIFCFHFAGGSKYSYRQFISLAADNLRFIPIELPGRGARVRETLLTDMEMMADDLLDQIRNRLDVPYAIYGHSMGALLAYMVTVRIIRMGLNKPLHLFVSGCEGPSAARSTKGISALPREEFIRKVEAMGGFPDDLLRQPEIINFFEPILRSDFQSVETYNYEPTTKLDLPITVMIGDDEQVKYKEACEWRQETTHDIEIKIFPGKHFFIFEHTQEIINNISSSLGLGIAAKNP